MNKQGKTEKKKLTNFGIPANGSRRYNLFAYHIQAAVLFARQAKVIEDSYEAIDIPLRNPPPLGVFL